MELIERAKEIIEKLNLTNPIIDFQYDKQKNISGYVADESFENKSPDLIQKMLWKALKDNLSSEEFIRVIAIFNETPKERMKRLTGDKEFDPLISKYWIHQTPDLAKYWLFVDVIQLKDEYSSFYYTICEKYNFEKGTKLHYDREVISFMELEHEEIYSEIFTNIFGLGEVEIQTDIMSRYETLANRGILGQSNPYFYVYSKFEMHNCSQARLIFSKGEIEMIRKYLKRFKEFEIFEKLRLAIDYSERILQSKEDI
jgi:hypothetical protein